MLVIFKAAYTFYRYPSFYLWDEPPFLLLSLFLAPVSLYIQANFISLVVRILANKEQSSHRTILCTILAALVFLVFFLAWKYWTEGPYWNPLRPF